MEEFIRLKGTRKRPVPGDIFAFQFVRKPGVYFFGRVIRDDVPYLGEKCVLLYFYRDSASTPNPPATLSPGNLVVPPIITLAIFFTSRRYFETVEHCKLQPEDKLKNHVFRDALRENYYFNADGIRLRKPAAGMILGEYSLTTNIGIEAQLMKPLIGVDHLLNG